MSKGSETRAELVERAALLELRRDGGLAGNAMLAAGALASLEVADAIRGQNVARSRDRSTVETILSVVRHTWTTDREELDAIYEALRHAGHKV